MKKFLILLIVIITILTGTFIFINSKNNEIKIERTLSITEQQKIIDDRLNKLSGYSVDKPYIELNPYGNSPLSALIYFECDENKIINIEIKGKDEFTSINHEFISSNRNYLPIYGLYADYDNEIIITFDGKDYKYNIKTGKLPEDFIEPTYVECKKGYETNDVYFVTPSNIGYTAAYDINGNVRWYYDGLGIWDIKRQDSGNIILSSNRLISSPYYTTGFMELDLLGKVYSEYTINGGYHHDVFELPNGNYLVCSNEFEDGTVEDVVVEVDRATGKIVKSIDLKDILNVNEAKNDAWTKIDWFHNNSVYYDENTNSIVLSGRHQDSIVSIDYETLKLNWIISDPEGYSNDMSKYLFTPINELEWNYYQHAAMVLPNGDIFVFDNGNNRAKNPNQYISADDNYSRGVIFHLDIDNMTIEQVYQYGKELGSDFYSPYISDVDYLDDHHYLIHSGGIAKKDGHAVNVPASFIEGAELKSRTIEVIDDNKVFEMVLPSHYYRAEKMSLYNDKNNFNLINGILHEDLKPSKIKEEKIGLIDSSITMPEEYKLNIKYEQDRINVTGIYHQNDVIDIVLRNGLKEYYYPVLITNNQYTAMCVYIPSAELGDEYKQVSKYININGLPEGKYNVYMKINNEVYNTNEYFEVE